MVNLHGHGLDGSPFQLWGIFPKAGRRLVVAKLVSGGITHWPDGKNDIYEIRRGERHTPGDHVEAPSRPARQRDSSVAFTRRLRWRTTVLGVHGYAVEAGFHSTYQQTRENRWSEPCSPQITLEKALTSTYATDCIL